MIAIPNNDNTNEIHLSVDGDHKKSDDVFNFHINDLKDIIEADNTIVNITYHDLTLIDQLYAYTSGQCTLISFSEDLDCVMQAREIYKNPNTLFFNSSFMENDLKNNSVDVIIGKRVFGNPAFKHHDLVSELKRLLPVGGRFVFTELISYDKLLPKFKKFYEGFPLEVDTVLGEIVCNIRKKLRSLRNFSCEIKLMGNGNYIFNRYDDFILQEFCDYFNMSPDIIPGILSKIFLVKVKGTKIS